MDHLWDTTWYEDLIFFATFFASIFALMLVVYAIVVTVLSAMNRYSIDAIAVYWSTVALTLIIGALSNVFVALLFWIWSSIPVACIMLRFERKRKAETDTI